MDLKERLKEMGLEGTDDQLVTAIQGFKDKAVVADAVCGVLECTAAPDQAEGKARELKLTAGQVEQYRASHNELVELKANTAVAEAEKGGKIAPTQRDEAVAWAKRDIEGFKRWMASQPPTVPVGPATTVAGDSGAADGKLTAMEEAFCRTMQLDPEKFKKA